MCFLYHPTPNGRKPWAWSALRENDPSTTKSCGTSTARHLESSKEGWQYLLQTAGVNESGG
jgi:hypothetical protein